MEAKLGVEEFRRQVRSAHREAFELHSRVTALFEGPFLGPRLKETRIRIALDMMMYQALKSNGAVSLLVQYALMEDAATIARRLMEVAVQAMYLWADGDLVLQEARASRYLAFLWRGLPPQALKHMPSELQAEWKAIDDAVGEALKVGAKRWGPNWKDMFLAVNAGELYDEDYSFLSRIGHGSAEELAFKFSQATLNMHRYDEASSLLHYASKYFLIVSGMWNNSFECVPDAEVGRMIHHVDEWERSTPGAT